MEVLNNLKKLSPTVAGIVYILYAAILMLSGVRGMAVISSLAILGVGITCFIEKAEPVKIVLLLICALLSFFSVCSTFFGFLRMFFEGVISILNIIMIPLTLLTSALRVIALAMLAALVFVSWKKLSSAITRFWYLPAVITVISAFMDAFIRVFNLISYGISIGHFFFGLLFDTIVLVVLSLVYAVGQAALGLSTVAENKKMEDATVVADEFTVEVQQTVNENIEEE